MQNSGKKQYLKGVVLVNVIFTWEVKSLRIFYVINNDQMANFVIANIKNNFGSDPFERVRERKKNI